MVTIFRNAEYNEYKYTLVGNSVTLTVINIKYNMFIFIENGP